MVDTLRPTVIKVHFGEDRRPESEALSVTHGNKREKGLKVLISTPGPSH